MIDWIVIRQELQRLDDELRVIREQIRLLQNGVNNSNAIRVKHEDAHRDDQAK